MINEGNTNYTKKLKSNMKNTQKNNTYNELYNNDNNNYNNQQNDYDNNNHLANNYYTKPVPSGFFSFRNFKNKPANYFIAVTVSLSKYIKPETCKKYYYLFRYMK